MNNLTSAPPALVRVLARASLLLGTTIEKSISATTPQLGFEPPNGINKSNRNAFLTQPAEADLTYKSTQAQRIRPGGDRLGPNPVTLQPKCHTVS